MKHGVRASALVALGTALLFLGACGDDTVAPPDNGGNGGGGGGGPIEVFDIFLRPYVVQRASSLAGNLPNPQQSLYYLTAFYRGGQPTASFTWQFDPRLGEILPKTIALDSTSATVSILNDGQTPLGIYEIAVEAQSGGLKSTLRKRFAVAELNWMKHERAFSSAEVQPELEQSPVFVPDGAADRIYFVASPSLESVSLWAIQADARLATRPQTPEMSLFVVPSCDADSGCPWGTVNSVQAREAEERDPDPSPPGMGRDELLFSSQMDHQWVDRLSVRNSEKRPLNLWVAKRPTAMGIPFRAHVLTNDAKFDSLGGTYYRTYSHRGARWDPSAVAGPGQPARIGFLSNRGPDPQVTYGTELWLADLHDMNADGASDSLMNLRRVTTSGGVTSFDWTPDGQFIYFLRAGRNLIYRLSNLNAANPTVEEISLAAKDADLQDFRSISVFRADGNLLTFQAMSENRIYLLIYDLAADELIRVTPYEFPIGRSLYPRWHPTRREIVFVCDYTVARWLEGGDVYPIGSAAEVGGMKRTLYPSVWTVRLQER